MLNNYSPKLSFKTTRDRSMSSLLSIGSQRTPKLPRKSSSSANTSSNSSNSNSSFTQNEKTVTIRCQRINPDKNNTFEEVDVEVTIKLEFFFYNLCLIISIFNLSNILSSMYHFYHIKVPAPIFETLRFYNGNSVPPNPLSDNTKNLPDPQIKPCNGKVKVNMFATLLLRRDGFYYM